MPSRGRRTKGGAPARGTRRRPAVVHALLHGPRKQRRRGARGQRGLLANVGNMLLPGIGGVVGQVADNFVGSAVQGFFNGSKSAPVARAGRMRSNQIHTSHEHGTEELAVVTVPANTPAGTILLQFLLSAPNLGVRLSKFSELWSNVRFNGLAFTVTSSNPSTVGGNYTVAIDPDPVQSYSSGPTLPSRLLALVMASRANAWADAYVSMLPKRDLLYNKFHSAGAGDAEIREYAVGQFILATTTDYEDDCTYTVNLDWDVTFERPDTQPIEGGPEPNTYVLTTVGRQATVVTATPNVARFPDAQNVWNRKPPLGSYVIYGGLTASTALGTRPVVVVEVLAANTDLFCATPLIWGAAGSVITITNQTPSSYVLDGATLVAMENGRKLVKSGYALVHPYYLKNGHQVWYQRSQVLALDKLRKSAARETLKNRIADQMADLTVEELRSQSTASTHDATISPPSYGGCFNEGQAEPPVPSSESHFGLHAPKAPCVHSAVQRGCMSCVERLSAALTGLNIEELNRAASGLTTDEHVSVDD